jgi:hypothetical protein
MNQAPQQLGRAMNRVLSDLGQRFPKQINEQTINKVSSQAQILQTRAVGAAQTLGDTVIQTLNEVDPKVSVPRILNAAERGFKGLGPNVVFALNNLHQLRHPCQSAVSMFIIYPFFRCSNSKMKFEIHG